GRQVRSRKRGASECQSVELSLALGSHAQRLPDTGVVSSDGQTARFSRPGLVEEYGVSMDGVQQDFIIERRPEGDGELQVELALTGAKAEPLAARMRLVLGGIRTQNRLQPPARYRLDRARAA